MGCIDPVLQCLCDADDSRGKPGWWLILFFIPFVNIVISIMVVVVLAAKFGKGGAFAVGMIFLPFIFYPILGLGSAEYQPVPALGH